MNLKQEQRLRKVGYRYIAGVDEVGRGALAGPVAAAAVVIARDFSPEAIPLSMGLLRFARNNRIRNELLKIKDSKHLTPVRRDKYYRLLTDNPGIVWSVAMVPPKTIDKIGIDRAVWRAMEKAVMKLKPRPDFLLIDGNRFHSYKLKPITSKLIIKGDEKIFSIAAASVIAKVTRDRLMTRLAKKYPQYGFEKHKGYGTAEHFKALKKCGLSEIHRKSFL